MAEQNLVFNVSLLNGSLDLEEQQSVSQSFALTFAKLIKGDTGAQGPQGPAGALGSVTADIDGTTGTPAVEVTYDGTDAHFAFKHIKGAPGTNGAPGTPGAPGAPGADGHTPVITAERSGSDTIIKSDGVTVATIHDGTNGTNGRDGAPGAPGAAGVGIASITLNENYTLTITLTNGTSVTTTSIRGAQGAPGTNGTNGQDGAPGPNQVTTATDTTLSGLIKGEGGKAAQAVPGTDYQAPLTFDQTPTAGSTNPVTSRGVKTALDAKMEKYLVTFSYDDSVLVCDKTPAQIYAAHASGKLVIAQFEGDPDYMYLLQCATDEYTINFYAYIGDDDSADNALATIRYDNDSEGWEEGLKLLATMDMVGSPAFLVSLSDVNNSITSDKTRDEIEAAITDGKIVVARYNECYYLCKGIDNYDEIHFCSISSASGDLAIELLICYGSNSWNYYSYNSFGAASASEGGNRGFVPAPSAGDQNKYLAGDATWKALPSVDATPTQGSTNAVQSGGVKAALDNKADKTAIETPASAASYEVVANKQYRLGTLSGNTTITLASYSGADLAVYDFVFTTPATAPTITWPAGITWAGGNAPTINASKTYEVNIVNNLAVIVEF